MKIRIIGGGWQGCHLASTLFDIGYDIELHEAKSDIFLGASGANPARQHLGFHYPRSKITRLLCQNNYKKFMALYGDFTRTIPINIYAIAKDVSLVDFENYKQILRNEVQFIELEKPNELGLKNVEGAVLTGERHILVNNVRTFFKNKLNSVIKYNTPYEYDHGKEFDLTVDCTFCKLDQSNVSRFEPCVTHIFNGDWNKSVTIMDGQLPSLYSSFNPGTLSLTSAKYTPLSKTCKTYETAQNILNKFNKDRIKNHVNNSVELMCRYYPEFYDYKYLDSLFAVRAMPKSESDSRPWELNINKNTMIVKSGKIDSIINVSELIVKNIQNDFK